ncbi:hypothetical protein PoB_003009700 [Plakobranchus ocellatus]|uniref:Uncharacterized protein n=1 Tax=Plakobranchus ocellatus TaxID=259542 RepID=A0AAV4A8M5_9GAST|nr:hypothetical protein PoB_003009700 [Plakobranchus ocellatus]
MDAGKSLFTTKKIARQLENTDLESTRQKFQEAGLRWLKKKDVPAQKVARGPRLPGKIAGPHDRQAAEEPHKVTISHSDELSSAWCPRALLCPAVPCPHSARSMRRMLTYHWYLSGGCGGDDDIGVAAVEIVFAGSDSDRSSVGDIGVVVDVDDYDADDDDGA